MAAFNILLEFDLVVLVSPPGLVGLLGEESVVTHDQGGIIRLVIVGQGEGFGDDALMIQGVHPAEAFLAAGQHFGVLAVCEPVFLGNLGEIDESIGEPAYIVQRIGSIDAEGEGRGILASQLGFLGSTQVSGELFDVGGLFHVQGLQPVFTDEDTDVRAADPAGIQEPLHAITLANLQQLTSELNAKINDRNSSLGLLLNDRGLYDNANGAVMILDSLLNDIKANPKRYVTIKVF